MAKPLKSVKHKYSCVNETIELGSYFYYKVLWVIGNPKPLYLYSQKATITDNSYNFSMASVLSSGLNGATRI